MLNASRLVLADVYILRDYMARKVFNLESQIKKLNKKKRKVKNPTRYKGRELHITAHFKC